MSPLLYFLVFLLIPALLGGPAILELIHNPLPPTQRRIFIVIATIVLGGSIFLAFWFSYTPAPDVKVISFPFPSSTIEMINGAWPDYRSPLSPFIKVWNVLFMFSTFLFMAMITKKIIDASAKNKR